HLHLTASAGRPAAAHAFDINAELARGVEDRRAFRKPASLAGWHEKDERIGNVGGRVHAGTPVRWPKQNTTLSPSSGPSGHLLPGGEKKKAEKPAPSSPQWGEGGEA